MDISKLKLTDADFQGKGVSAQSNPMEKPEDEAKAVFDELAKEVLAPRINEILEELKDIDTTADKEKPISDATQEALDLKVDKELRTGSEAAYKVLSDNNYTDQEKENLAENTQKRHEHQNKSLLDGLTHLFKMSVQVISKNFWDGLTPEDIENWNGGNVLTKDNETPYEPKGPYQPATKKYVDETVVAIGAADMTRAVYDPNGRATDIFAAIDDAKFLTDDVTEEKYVLGVSNGGLYYKKVENATGEVAET